MRTQTRIFSVFTLLTTACSGTDFTFALDSGAPTDAALSVVDVQTKLDADTDASPTKADANTPQNDAGVDSKDPTPDASASDSETPDSGHVSDTGPDTSKNDAGMTDPDSGLPVPDAGSTPDSSTPTDAGSTDAGSTPDSAVDAPVVCTPTSCAGNVPQAICQGTIKSFPACSGADAVCLNGACVTCTPGENRCTTPVNNPNLAVGGSYYSGFQTCNAQGAWDAPVACSPGALVCNPSAGTCETTTCTPGEGRCDPIIEGFQACPGNLNNGYQACDNTGNWGATVGCPSVNGGCVYNCQAEGLAGCGPST